LHQRKRPSLGAITTPDRIHQDAGGFAEITDE
jgi:hypothetical protein